MAESTRQWRRRFDPGDVRELTSEINDGIIAVAGMGLGLAGAGISWWMAHAVILISSLAGALSVFGVQLGEAFAEREAQQSMADEEQRLLELSPAEEIKELSDWFEAKGVTPETAQKVAEEMSEADALSSQLLMEYGIDEVISSKKAWLLAARAGVAFLIGSLTPVLVTLLAPTTWRSEYTILTAIGALSLTSVFLAFLGRSNFRFTLFRTLSLGLGTMALSYFLGDWLL